MGKMKRRESPQPEPTSASTTVTPTEAPPSQPDPTEPPAGNAGEIVFQSFAVDLERITVGECAGWLMAPIWMELQVIVDQVPGVYAPTQPAGESGPASTLPPAS